MKAAPENDTAAPCSPQQYSQSPNKQKWKRNRTKPMRCFKSRSQKGSLY